MLVSGNADEVVASKCETCLTVSGEKMDGHWVVGVVVDHLYSRN